MVGVYGEFGHCASWAELRQCERKIQAFPPLLINNSMLANGIVVYDLVGKSCSSDLLFKHQSGA